MTFRFLILVLPGLLFSTNVLADSVPAGQSSLIGTPDFSDTFTLGTGNRTELEASAFPVGSFFPDALLVENTHANPEAFWSDSRWSISDDANVNNGTPPYPGGSGGGSATGMTETGNAVDFGLEYDLREDFVVQFDAVQTTDRINLTVGNARDAIADGSNPEGISVFIREDGHAGPEVGVYNEALGEVDTELDTGLAGARIGQWHNYAVRFNLPEKKLTVYVDEIDLGTVDLATLTGENIEAGAFAALITEASNDAISVGGAGGTRLWTDNFQAGSFGISATPGLRLGAVSTVRDTKNTVNPADDTFSISLRVIGRGPLSPAGWTVALPAGVTGPVSGAYGAAVTFQNFPVSAPEVTLTFTDAATVNVNAAVTVHPPSAPPPVTQGIAVGASNLISVLDFSDGFTIGDGAEGTRNGEAYAAGGFPIAAGSPLLAVENTYGSPAQSWSPALWSLNNNAVIADGDPSWPGDSGTGSATGITQTGGSVDYGLEYGKREDFVVQFDAVQTPDRINITAGNVRDDIAGASNPNGISVFFRADGHATLPEVGIYNAALGEVDAGMDTGLAGVRVGEWHNYAVRFNFADKTLTVFVDEKPLGTLDLSSFGGGAVAPGAFVALLTADSNKAVSVGGAGGNRLWTDNFQTGKPAGIPVGASPLISTLDYSETFTIGAGDTDHIRNSEPYAIGGFPLESEALLAVENSHGNPPQFWTTARWSLNNDAVILDGIPAWPGGIGGGSATGMTQTGGGVDCGIEYDKRDDFVVQFDAVQTGDRINITAGNVRDDIAGASNPAGISVFFRADGHATLPEIGIYNEQLGEVSAELDTGLAGVAAGEWHNYAVRFNFQERKLVLYVDGIELGTVDLNTFGGEAVQGRGLVEPGAFAALISEFSNDAVSVGGAGAAGENRLWTDNFQIGAPAEAVSQADTDGDGMTDADEIIAGTDPANPASVLRFSGFVRTGAQPAVHEGRFPTVAGRFYRIYSSADLTAWTREDVLGTIPGNGAEAVVTLEFPPGAVRRFHRIHVNTVDDFPAVAP